MPMLSGATWLYQRNSARKFGMTKDARVTYFEKIRKRFQYRGDEHHVLFPSWIKPAGDS
jgi:hypothetical protein